ncbi:hypothetical protein LTR56_023565 [Elasticomyces elasticus]|nr:hypothetical protein LTR56_023565 [Elasticomyces elasticus]KAK3624233.1 hypothetical protein LTR22_024061 [Elasticomyces elasticus]KAK4906085.1 hypothetical protein LTR49_024713 [Elasticomyces elasticus]KAK5744111.1 hypothetical protein LTS12_023587 [Elasticomyces elasticus]
MNYLHDQGLDWKERYNEAAYFGQGFDKDLNTLDVNITTDTYPFEHGVNVGQGLKAVAAVRRFTQNDSLIQAAYAGVNWTMTYYRGSHDSVIADERLWAWRHTLAPSCAHQSKQCTLYRTCIKR